MWSDSREVNSIQVDFVPQAVANCAVEFPTRLFPILSVGIPYLSNNPGRVRNAVVVTAAFIGIVGNTDSLSDPVGQNITGWIIYERCYLGSKQHV